MRNRYFYLMIFGAMLVWMVAMGMLPTRTVPQSGLLIPGGIILFVLIFSWTMYLETFQRTHGASAPGFRTTLWNPEPHLTIKIGNFPNSPGLREYNLYKLNGTHWGPIEGGGKDGGYAIIPTDLDYLLPGERSQRWWNVAYRWYRENPNAEKGELDLMYIPGPLYKALKNIDGWHKKAAVMFGYLPFFKFDALVKNRDLQDLVNFQTLRLAEQAQQNEKLLTALSQYATVAEHIAQSYGPAERRMPEKKPLFNLPKLKEGEE